MSDDKFMEDYFKDTLDELDSENMSLDLNDISFDEDESFYEDEDGTFYEDEDDSESLDLSDDSEPLDDGAIVMSFSDGNLGEFTLDLDEVNDEDYSDPDGVEFTEEGEVDDLSDELDADEPGDELSIVDEEDVLEFLEDDKEPEVELDSDVSDSFLPGVSEPIYEEKEEPVIEKDTNWADDRDTSKFMEYLRDGFANIPKHNGMSISGCERALTYLNKLSREISEAVRKDDNGALDENLDEIENFRVKILKGMVALKNRIKELKTKVNQVTKKATDDTKSLIKEAMPTQQELTKVAKSGKFEVVVTAFERAITGILINSVVSAGNPFEDVYEYLKKKFDLTPREELAILQIVMDMGFPVFKDRGTIGDDDESGEDLHGVEFIKNYFA